MKPHKLFHAVVIVGASLTGCGGSEGGEDAGADSGEMADAGEMDADMDADMDAAGTDDGGSHDATGDDGMVLIL